MKNYSYKFMHNGSINYCIKIMGAFLFTVLLMANPSFSQITVDGNPADWANFNSSDPVINPNLYTYTRAFAPDVFNASGNSDDQFTQGSKDGSLISKLRWSNGSANAKGDIANSGAVLIGSLLYFFADRHAVNGDAAIGFWFYKTPVSKNPNGTFSGEHVNGDLLVISHFTNGGGQSDIYEYRWTGSGPGALVFLGTSNNAMVNSQTYNVPSPMVYSPKFGSPNTYPTGSFFEGSVNLAAIYGQNVPVCFATFLAETRNSQSITASLQDLAYGSFTSSVVKPTVTVTEASLCGSAYACILITSPQPGSYTMSQPDNQNYGTNGSRTIQYPNNDGKVEFCDLVPGGKFSVYYTNSGGCSSEPTTCGDQVSTKQAAPGIKQQSGNPKDEVKQKEMTAFPIPFSDKVTIEFRSKKAENYVINLYDMQGKLVKQLAAGNAKAGELTQLEVDGKIMVDSMYLVRKESKAGVETVKLLKKE